MKRYYWLVFILIIFLFACQPATPLTVTIIDNDKTFTLQTRERVPSTLFHQSGIAFSPNDRVLLNGLPVAPNQSLTQSQFTKSQITLQIRRAVSITVVTPDGEQKLRSSAFTVGEALQEASIWLRAGDKVEPALDTLLTDGMRATIAPTRPLTVSMDGRTVQIQSSARTVGEALAEAGIPLIGLDYSLPAENDPLPSDGQIRVVRVSESVILAQKPIPFESEFQASADVPLDQTQILEPGENGLTVQRIRIRYADGEEIARMIEEETLVRPPKTRIMAYGTKIEIKTAVVNGVTIEYWRAMQMYATSYSPCRSGVDECHSGTSSGKSLRKGMVGLRYSWYLSMQGQPLYIPGYGFATVEDVCGGCVGKPWIDLGYSDNDYEQWGSAVTVYFLAPVPANIPYDLQ
jgi:resuscitation-promoting factor RpfB